jgi:hypothetical protein
VRNRRVLNRPWPGLVLLIGAALALKAPAALRAKPPEEDAGAVHRVRLAELPPASDPWAAPAAHAEAVPQTHLFLTGELLALQPRQRYLDYAVLVPRDATIADGPPLALNYEFRPGFRVGGGLQWCEDWRAAFFYTNFYSKDQANALAAGTDQMLLATRLRPGLIVAVDRADAGASINFNLYDLEIGRALPVSEGMSILLFSGVRFVNFQQQIIVEYHGLDAIGARSFQRQELDGFGLRLGGEWDLDLGCHFSLFTRVAGSLLSCQSKTTVLETTDLGTTLLTNWRDSSRRIVPAAELALGVSYETHCLKVAVGYQLIQWFGLVDVQDFVSDLQFGKTVRRAADLGFDGLLVQLQFTY